MSRYVLAVLCTFAFFVPTLGQTVISGPGANSCELYNDLRLNDPQTNDILFLRGLRDSFRG